MKDTKLVKLDALLERVNIFDNIAQDVLDHTFNGNKELKTHKRRTARQKRLTPELQEIVFNISNRIGKDLMDKVKINFSIIRNYGQRFAGRYFLNDNRIEITLSNENDSIRDNKWHRSTIMHEVGHAFHYQMSSLLKIDQDMIPKKTLTTYFKLRGEKIKRMNSKAELLRHSYNYISYYAKKSLHEAYAELFIRAFEENEKAAILAISETNSWIRNKINYN